MSSLVDPNQFAPPPKHSGWYGPQAGDGQKTLGAPQGQAQIEYAPQQQQYQQQPQQYQQQPTQSQELSRPSPALPGRPQQHEEEEPIVPRELRPGPDGYADTSRPSVPSFKDGPPQPLPARNPAGVQTKPWAPGQKKDRDAPPPDGLSAAQRYQARVRNYGGGAGSASWNAPGSQPTPPPQQQQYEQPPQAQVQYQTAAEVLGEDSTAPPRPSEPFKIDSTGLSTSHLPPPPRFQPQATDGSTPSSARASPAPPARGPGRPASSFAPPPSGVPGRKNAPAPPPRLPARQNSNPDEYTPPGPPAYTPQPVVEARQEMFGAARPSGYEAPKQQAARPVQSGGGGGGGGGSGNAQLSELQARFARMGKGESQDGGAGNAGANSESVNVARAVAAKKAPPPKPVKKVGVAGGAAGGGPAGGSGSAAAGAPPAIPFSSRPSFQ